MEAISKILSQNLKRIREAQGLSLDRMAELTGVSKSMLYQMERAQSCPSITTLYKISNALKISLSQLVSEPQPDTIVVSTKDVRAITSKDHSFRIYTMFPCTNERGFEIFYSEIMPGGGSSSEAHQAGTREYITVFEGDLNVYIDNKTFHVPAQHAIGFAADVSHSYHNPGIIPVVFCDIIHYAHIN